MVVQFVNALGSYLRDQMDLLGWSRSTLVARTRLDPYELEAVLDSPVLPEWPQPDTLMGLARALSVATVVGTLAVAASAVRVGHAGGRLVYEHNAGAAYSAPGHGSASTVTDAEPLRNRDRDDR